MFAEQVSGSAAPSNPAKRLAAAMRGELGDGATALLVHATNFSDDRQVMTHLGNAFREEGLLPVLAGPQNVEFRSGAPVAKLGGQATRADGIVRFFPAEWLPQVRSRADWRDWFRPCESVLCNPAHAIVLQTKRFPLIWPHLDADLSTWRKCLPETRCVSEADDSHPDWVAKPVFGRVGEDVAMKDVVSEQELARLWKAALRKPEEWIAQKRFETLPVQTENGCVYPCLGVFTVNGEFAGVYGRAGRTPLINQEAQDVAVLITRKAL